MSRRGFIRRFERYIENKFIKTSAFVEEAPTEDLLHLMEGYGLVKGIITEVSPLVGSAVSEFKSISGKSQVLGIERKDDWLPIPSEDEKIQPGDRIVIYGNLSELKTMFKEA